MGDDGRISSLIVLAISEESRMAAGVDKLPKANRFAKRAVS
jgi:hypothetical protein